MKFLISRPVAAGFCCFTLCSGFGRIFGQDAAEAQHDIIGVSKSEVKTAFKSQADTTWFKQAGLGLFIHFGIASVGGHQDLSWSMIKDTPWNKHNLDVLTPNAYYALANNFNPTNYNPDEWLKAAKEAGFGYAVMTTRHHDGFALWPSAYGDLNIKQFMGGRDLVKEFVEACRRNGLRVGFYYSSPDWYHERDYKTWGYNTKGTPESPHLDMNHQPVTALPKRPADFEAETAAYLNGQIHELLTQYGQIDYLWFDGSQKGVMSLAEIKKLQPAILINDRQHGSGDVMTAQYEGKLPKERPHFLWEHCFSMVGAWSYTKPVHCQPAESIEEKLAKCRTWGGNVLADFGPQPDGDMPPEYYQCLTQLKVWMEWAASAVVGVQPGPYPEKCNVPMTVNGDSWYAFLPTVKAGDQTQIILKTTAIPQAACLLQTGRALPITSIADGFSITVPTELITNSVNIVKIVGCL